MWRQRSQVKIYHSFHHESSETLPKFPPSSLSPIFGLADAVSTYISEDGAHFSMNARLLRRHYMRFEYSLKVDHSVASPPPAAIIARRANALCSVTAQAFPIDVHLNMSTTLWMDGLRKPLKRLRDALSQVSNNDRFLSRTRMPPAVWVDMMGLSARLLSAFGRTSASISAACLDHLHQLQHSSAAAAALAELACPTRPDELQAKRLRLMEDWMSQWLIKDRRTGTLKPRQTRDELRKAIVKWNTANKLRRGMSGFLSKRGSSTDLLHKLAEATANKQLSLYDVMAAQERMSSCPGLRTNEVPPAGIPPSEWSSASSRGKEVLLAAAAMRGSLVEGWFRSRAQLAPEVELEQRDLHDDELDFESEEASDDM